MKYNWWHRIKKELTPQRSLKIPKLDKKLLDGMKLAVKDSPLSEQDLKAISLLRNNFIKSGVIDNDDSSDSFADTSIEKLMKEAGETGSRNSSELPGFDDALIEKLAKSDGGENFMLDEFDIEENVEYNSYSVNSKRNQIEVKSTDELVELKLADGTVVKSYYPTD